MSPLRERLKARIAAEGPISLADYMALALGDPEEGYYMQRDPLGAAGDFTTAPEISQLFGELLGLWCLDFWRRSGRPAPILLVELGPGRGTLLRDFLRAANLDPAFRQALALHLVETSPALRARQRAALEGEGARWHESFEEVPLGPLLLLANEFFDALPIRQFRRAAAGWRERLVGLDPEGAGLAFRDEPGDPPPAEDLSSLPEGSVLEISSAARSLAATLGARLARCGGAALVIDYGRWGALGESLQALRGHRAHPVLEEPGTADITAHVDFAALAAAAEAAGAKAFGPEPLGRFLTALGIEARAAGLLAGASEGQARQVRTALWRLTAPAAMGELFKVLALLAPEAPPPAGLSPAPFTRARAAERS